MKGDSGMTALAFNDGVDCSICGRSVEYDETYHTFGDAIDMPIEGQGEWVEMDPVTIEVDGETHTFPVADWVGATEKYLHVECDACFNSENEHGESFPNNDKDGK